MKQLIWLMIGFALASSVVGCIYRLGYLHGEIAALEIVELRRECAMGFATGSER